MVEAWEGITEACLKTCCNGIVSFSVDVGAYESSETAAVFLRQRVVLVHFLEGIDFS